MLVLLFLSTEVVYVYDITDGHIQFVLLCQQDTDVSISSNQPECRGEQTARPYIQVVYQKDARKALSFTDKRLNLAN